jgi:hypothetical protein
MAQTAPSISHRKAKPTTARSGAAILELDYEPLEMATIDEMMRQSELRQQAMFQAAMGMDQRAFVAAAGLMAASGALAAGAVSLIGARHQPVLVACVVAALWLMVAAGHCAWVGRAQKFRFPGIEPDNWADQQFLANDLRGIKLGALARAQDAIVRNEAQQDRNGRYLRRGIWLAGATPGIALIAALITALV